MRLYAFDNLRLASIFIVIVFHAMCGYTANVDWWYVNVQDGTRRYLIFMGLADLFVMATMFFVAGFFAAKSQRKKDNTGYLKQRLQRLLLPGYLQLMLVGPLLFFIAKTDFSFDAMTHTYLTTWKTLWQFEFVTIEPGSMSFHHHIWFVEVLFIIGAFFMLTRRWLNGFLLAEDTSYGVIAGKFIAILIVGWAITFGVVQMGFGPHDWQNMGGFVVAQPARLGAYVAAYALGLYFFGLYNRLPLKKLFWVSVLAIVGFVAINQIAILLLKTVLLKPTVLQLALSSSGIFVCFSLMLSTTFLFLKFINAKYSWIAPLYPLNYGIYLMHMLFVVALQRALVNSEWNIDVRVAVISIVALLLSIASTYIKQRVQSKLTPGPNP